jgi:3',5'-cyclic AMP phosphodiesterase CpdA
MPERPSFVLHTEDLTHLSESEEFDTLQQVLSDLMLPVSYVPGEHDPHNVISTQNTSVGAPDCVESGIRE